MAAHDEPEDCSRTLSMITYRQPRQLRHAQDGKEGPALARSLARSQTRRGWVLSRSVTPVD